MREDRVVRSMALLDVADNIWGKRKEELFRNSHQAIVPNAVLHKPEGW